MVNAYRSGFATMLGFRYSLAISQLADNGRYDLETVSEMKTSPRATTLPSAMCGTARKSLEILRDDGVDVWVREYWKDRPGRDELSALYQRAGITPREGLRAKEPLADELGLTRPDVTDDQVLDAMI